MTKKKYRSYSPEFKRHALKRASEDGVTDKGVCEELGISARQLRRWRDQYRLLGDQAFPGQGKSRDEEMAELKRKLAKAEQERDFHMVIFVNQNVLIPHSYAVRTDG